MFSFRFRCSRNLERHFEENVSHISAIVDAQRVACRFHGSVDIRTNDLRQIHFRHSENHGHRSFVSHGKPEPCNNNTLKNIISFSEKKHSKGQKTHILLS